MTIPPDDRSLEEWMDIALGSYGGMPCVDDAGAEAGHYLTGWCTSRSTCVVWPCNEIYGYRARDDGKYDLEWLPAVETFVFDAAPRHATMTKVCDMLSRVAGPAVASHIMACESGHSDPILESLLRGESFQVASSL